MLWPGLQALQIFVPAARLLAELNGLLPFTSGRTHTPSTGGTPDSLLLHRQEGQEAGDTPDTDLQPQQGSGHTASMGRPGIAGHLVQVSGWVQRGQVGPLLVWPTARSCLSRARKRQPHSPSACLLRAPHNCQPCTLCSSFPPSFPSALPAGGPLPRLGSAHLSRVPHAAAARLTALALALQQPRRCVCWLWRLLPCCCFLCPVSSLCSGGGGLGGCSVPAQVSLVAECIQDKAGPRPPCLHADSASLPSSRGLSVRRFPTLDSWGSLDGASSKPSSRMDSMAGLAAQRLTHTFAPEQQAAAQQAQQQEVAPADGAYSAYAPSAAARAQRKRQHSSRRTLMQALSRDNSVASSIDGMQPLGKARHISDSCTASPDAGAGAAGQQRLLMRSGSTLGREAAAAAAAMAAEISKATAAAGAAGEASAAATPCQRAFEGLFGEGGAAAAGAARSPFKAPNSPLHARMTCMKLRDTD